MTATTIRTMTAAQMAWSLKKGFAWEEKPDQEWMMPIWTKDGAWFWDATEQLYQLLIDMR